MRDIHHLPPSAEAPEKAKQIRNTAFRDIIFDLEEYIREAKCLSETMCGLFASKFTETTLETRSFLAFELNSRLDHIQTEYHRAHAALHPERYSDQSVKQQSEQPLTRPEAQS